jgi:hypothetical protein
MANDALWGRGDPGFLSGADAIASVERDGFDWKLIREYFRFTDSWLSEGQYEQLLSACLRSIEAPDGQQALLDTLDLQYAVFLEQVAVQERQLGHKDDDEALPVAFGERVIAYLQINHDYRPDLGIGYPSARTALLETPPGHLIRRLLGTAADE